MFSDAISSISWRWRPSSPRMAADISGSACSRVAVKNESGAEAVLALEDGGLIGEISPPPQAFKARCGRSCVAIESGPGGIPYRAAAAKHLRYRPDIYARYGGEGVPDDIPDRHSGAMRSIEPGISRFRVCA